MLIPEKLFAMRKLRGFTQEKLAELSQMSDSAIGHYEKGRITNVSHDALVRLAAALECTPAELTGDDPPPKPPKQRPENPWIRRKTAKPYKAADVKAETPAPPLVSSPTPATNQTERIVVRCELVFTPAQLALAHGCYLTRKKSGEWDKVTFLREALKT